MLNQLALILSSLGVGGLLGVFAKSVLDKRQLKFSKIFEYDALHAPAPARQPLSQPASGAAHRRSRDISSRRCSAASSPLTPVTRRSA